MLIEVNCKLTGIEMSRYPYGRSVFLFPLKSLNHNRRKSIKTTIVKRKR